MKRRTDLPEPPNFSMVSGSYEMARKVMSRCTEALRVGIVDRTGMMVAEGVLRGYTQASVFGEMLRKMGYQELLPRTAQRICECHVAYMAPLSTDDARPQPLLPQAVLDVDLWPGIGFQTSRRRTPDLVE